MCDRDVTKTDLNKKIFFDSKDAYASHQTESDHSTWKYIEICTELSFAGQIYILISDKFIVCKITTTKSHFYLHTLSN